MEISTEQIRENLHRLPFLGGIEKSILSRLEEYAVVLRYDQGEYIWFEGMPAFFLAVISEGVVELRERSGDRGPAPVGILEIVGPELLTGHGEYHATAICLEPTCVVAIPLRLVSECMCESEKLERRLKAAIAETHLPIAMASGDFREF